jgi:sigma-B regulation protein RsbU (phosphoserine phosphatase)
MSRAPRLLVVEPTGVRREVDISSTPFKMGRQAGNELTLRDSRVSRIQAQICTESGAYFLEDLGSRHGTFVNGQRVTRHELRSKDTIDFGIPDSYRLIFMGDEASIDDLLERVEKIVPAVPETGDPTLASQKGGRELYHLGVLLEVARVLHSGMTLEDVLTAVVDAAIQVTRTERGVLLLPNVAGELQPRVVRDSRRGTLRTTDVDISSSVLKQVSQSRKELIITDVGDAPDIRQQASVVRLALHTVIAIPLVKLPVMGSADTTAYGRPMELLGLLYMDSHQSGSAFSQLDHEVLRSLAIEAATVIENAKLFASAREKERLEHEMKIAYQIQQELLPSRIPQSEHFSVIGLNIPCYSVGGDYYDVIELPRGRRGFVVADVSGKGISAALLASMLQGVFSATAGMDIQLDVIAGRVNKYLCERSADDRYATLFYGVLDPSGRMDYINAGHVAALVRTTMGQVYPLASDNSPVGMFDFAEYHGDRAQLQPGDFVVIYTDGISEARNPRDDMFGEFGLRELVKKFTGSTSEELAEAVQKGVREFIAGAPQSDDMTLLIVHYHGPGAAAPAEGAPTP